MGMFRIQITGVGGHGVERHKEVGATVNFDAEGDWTVDSIARQVGVFAKRLFAERGITTVDAKLIHWPGGPGEVVDNLITGVRESGSFNRAWEEQPIMAGVAAEVAEIAKEETPPPDVGDTPSIEEPLVDAGVPAVATNEIVTDAEDFENSDSERI